MEKFIIKKPKGPTSTLENESSSSQSESNEEKLNLKKKRKRPFRNQWLNQYSWLRNKNGQSFCVVCNKELYNLKSHLQRHETLDIHKKKVSIRENQVKIDSYMNEEAQTLKRKVKDAEVALVMFCIVHHLSFSIMDHLPQLLQKCCSDSKIADNIRCARTKAINIAKEILGEKGKQDVVKMLKTQKFSLIADESTDVSCFKVLVLIARVFDEKMCTVRDRFLGLVKLAKSDADSIFQAIFEHFKSLEIPLSNLIGLATDGASVMAGEINGLQARLRRVNQHLFFVKCTCHSLHLCASYACRKFPSRIEEFVKEVCRFFAHSAKRNTEFEEFQDFLNLQRHKMLSLSQTRWLSFEAVINRILEQWNALQLYFVSCKLEDGTENARKLAEEMGKQETKLYLLFLSYVLKIVNVMNCEFQAKDLRIHMLYFVLENNIKILLSNFVRFNPDDPAVIDIDLSNNENYLPLHEIYMGIKVADFLKEKCIEEESLRKFQIEVQKFYVELIKQIKKRFDLETSFLKSFKVIDPKVATTQSSCEDVIKLLDRFPNFIDFHKREEVISEYKSLKYVSQSLKHLNMDKPEVFWVELSRIKNACDELLFQNVSKFMMGLMTFPHSSAAAERKFSDFQLIKNKKSNRFQIDTIQSIMFAKELLVDECSAVWFPISSDF